MTIIFQQSLLDTLAPKNRGVMRIEEKSGGGVGKGGITCLLFSVGQEGFAIRIEMLQEIVNPVGMKPIPSPEFTFCRELDFRGKRIPVLNLSDFFQYSPIPEGSKSVLVLRLEEESIGLLVDEVRGVWNIDEHDLRPFPPMATSLDPRHIRGIFKVEVKPIFCLNENMLFRLAEIRSFFTGVEDHP